MKQKYHYEDPDFLYTDKQTGVMHNKLNLTNNEELFKTETLYTYKRTPELEKKQIKIDNSKIIFAIHKHLFQDIYDWAGKPRQVEIKKSDHQFHPTSRFQQGFEYLDKLISKYNMIDNSDKQNLANSLAKILDTLNELHPFREGKCLGCADSAASRCPLPREAHPQLSIVHFQLSIAHCIKKRGPAPPFQLPLIVAQVRRCTSP